MPAEQAPGEGWYVERNGRRVALLTDPQFADMFWNAWRIEPLSDDPAEREALFTDDYWHCRHDEQTVYRSTLDNARASAIPAGHGPVRNRRLILRGPYPAEPSPGGVVRRSVAVTARVILAAFLITFLAARILVLLIMTRRIPDLYLYAGQTHVHHLNYGIFLLAAVGLYLLLFPAPRPATWSVMLYGIGLALTFDEFGMWLHLGGSYWQRASFDAVVIIAATLASIAIAPAILKFRPRHWATASLSVLLLGTFAWLTVSQWERLSDRELPRLEQIQRAAPQ